MNDNHAQFNKTNNTRSPKPPISGSNASFREAIRAQKRSHEEAQRLTDQYAAAVPAVSDNPDVGQT